MGLAYLLAVLAAVSNATSNVLQRKANREEPSRLSMSPKLIEDLLHRKVWLAGLLTVTLSFVLMAVALGMGRLASVQPVIVLELPLTLVGGAIVFGSRLHRREWAAAGAMTLGLAGLIVFLSPEQGKGQVSGLTWAIGLAVTVGLVAGMVAVGQRYQSGHRAALLGIATGATFGLTAALMKGMTLAFRHGILGVLTAWQTYAMIAGGLAGMFLMQNALQAGRLIAAQPGITLTDPAVAILWGVLAFREPTRTGWMLGMAIVSGLVMAAGGLALASSPLVEEGAPAEGQTDEARSARVGGDQSSQAGATGRPAATP